MKYIYITIFTILCSLNTWANGLIIPDSDTYPGDYLSNKSTSIEVNINGLIAETVVLQEFENESYETINGVYIFPLPMNARVTRLLYSKGDTLIDAVLKVKAQSSTPGTGEGGVVAEINKYMGKNAIKLSLINIQPGAIKMIRLHYITNLTQYNGRVEYSFPFNLSDFVSQPIDYLKLRIKVNSMQDIIDFDIPNHKGYVVNKNQTNALDISYFETKVYQAEDISFYYQADNEHLALDFYSWKEDTTDGYFSIIGHSPLTEGDTVLSQKVLFMVCNSITMTGTKLDQTKQAVIRCLDLLSTKDSFNIMTYNSGYTTWQSYFVPATPANIANAKTHVESITGKYGNSLTYALQSALNEIKSDDILSSFLIFTDGNGVVDPYAIKESNIHKTGLFLVAMGNDYDRARIETLASLNYGFVSYLTDSKSLSDQMVNIFSKIQRPLYKDIDISLLYPNVYDLYPPVFPAIYGNSDFIITGRYKTPGEADVNISGINNTGLQLFPFEVSFADSTMGNKFCKKLWTKNAMDIMEAELLIYGETDSLKSDLIELSLANKMRCRYTAYIEDSTFYGYDDDVYTGDEWVILSQIEVIEKKSSILKIYPMPIVNNSVINININSSNYEKRFIKIYSIHGKLIATIDISYLQAGNHEIPLYNSIANLTKGIYIISLEEKGITTDARKIVI